VIARVTSELIEELNRTWGRKGTNNAGPSEKGIKDDGARYQRKVSKHFMTKTNDVAEAIIMERTFDAPVAKVWKALTDVDQMREWYFDLKEFKPDIGFEFEFVVEHEGNTYHHLCRVTEVIPQKKIAYTWRYKGEPGDSLVTFELFPEGNKTRLKLAHTGIETFPKTPAYARKNFEAGWTAIIGSELKQFVESSKKES
jgi:uncharacterized protein YndB with AHSA1/START domain